MGRERARRKETGRESLAVTWGKRMRFLPKLGHEGGKQRKGSGDT